MSSIPGVFRTAIPSFLLIAIGIFGLVFATVPLRANPASFTLYGSITTPSPGPGWGFTSSPITQPGPTLTVAPGETVSLMLASADPPGQHQFCVDYEQPGDRICNAGEPVSPRFSSSTPIPYSFMATTTPGTYTYFCTIHGYAMSGPFIVQYPPDFGISASAASPASFLAGNSATSTITLTSLNGFAGSITLTAAISPVVTNGPTTSFSVNPVSLMAGGTGTSILTAVTTSSTPPGTYTITVTGSGTGVPSHSTTVSVTVVGPDFSISSSPAALNIIQGSSGNSTITLTSLNGFSGSVSLSVTISPTGPTASVSPTSVTLTSGGTATAVVKVSTSSGAYSSTPTGPYTVNINATSSPITHSTTVSLTVTSQNPSLVGNISASVLIGVIAAAVAVAVVAVFLVRRRPKP